MIETERPRLLNSLPREATVIPLPTDDATPPVTNRNFAMTLPSARPQLASPLYAYSYRARFCPISSSVMFALVRIGALGHACLSLIRRARVTSFSSPSRAQRERGQEPRYGLL